MSFLHLMTVLFIGLKLTSFIDWSWWLVSSPAIVHAVFVVIISSNAPKSN